MATAMEKYQYDMSYGDPTIKDTIFSLLLISSYDSSLSSRLQDSSRDPGVVLQCSLSTFLTIAPSRAVPGFKSSSRSNERRPPDYLDVSISYLFTHHHTLTAGSSHQVSSVLTLVHVGIDLNACSTPPAHKSAISFYLVGISTGSQHGSIVSRAAWVSGNSQLVFSSV